MLVRDARPPLSEDPRILRTRKLLTEALWDLVREKSFQSITVGQIAERATLNRVTFYAHFQDKFDLLEYAVRELIRDRIKEDLPNASAYSADNLRRLISLVSRFVVDLDKHCPPPHGQMQPVMEKQIKAEIYDLILTWVTSTRKQSKKGPSPQQAATVASWAIYGAALQWSREANPVPVEDFVRQVLPLITPNLKPFVSEETVQTVSQRAGGSPSSISMIKPILAMA